MAKIVTLFNHKGGVSKTTSTFNIAWKLTQLGKRVLLVDGDPQCNLTGLFMGDSFDDYYETQATAEMNIKDAVKVAFAGRPHPIKVIDCPSHINNDQLFLIPGHMDLSEYESSLNLAITSNNAIETLQNLPGAFYELISLCCEKYEIDYVFIDLNPGLSSINQVMFVYSDAFIVPTNPDPFSVMALKTLRKMLPKWKNWAEHARTLFEDSSYPLPNKQMFFLGEIISRFNIRNGNPAKSYTEKIEEIKSYVVSEFVPVLEHSSMLTDMEQVWEEGLDLNYCLAEIPEFGSLIQRSHEAMVPVYALSKDDMKAQGNVLQSMETKRQQLDEIYTSIAKIVIRLV